MTERIILLDGDIFAFQHSASNERTYDLDGDDVVAVDEDECFEKAVMHIDDISKKLKATRVILCLSDDFNNFRKDVLPTYKENRGDSKRPEELYNLKARLAKHYETELWPNLEADDVMGIMATSGQFGDAKVCIVSEDKDMQTIPGWLYNPRKDTKARLITPEAATRFFLSQVITGDPTDGYDGCKGAGPKAAEEVLSGSMYVQIDRTLKSGPRKGLTLSEWHNVDGSDFPVWDRIVSLYEKYGLTEADALQQARCAFILHSDHWTGSKPILWNPQKR